MDLLETFTLNIMISTRGIGKLGFVAANTHIKQRFLLETARTHTAMPAVSSSSPMPIPVYTTSKQEGCSVNSYTALSDEVHKH